VKRHTLLLVGSLAVVLASITTAVIVGVTRNSDVQGSTATASCNAPSDLHGSVVHVAVWDMGHMMGETAMGGGMMTRGDARPGIMGMQVSSARVAAGTVSFVVANVGYITHELVVLPLKTGSVGQRSVGADGKVSEAGSLGEASQSCGSGPGDGLKAETVGWVTLQLPAGRYELICNVPWHYYSGMYAELDVS